MYLTNIMGPKSRAMYLLSLDNLNFQKSVGAKTIDNFCLLTNVGKWSP